MLQQDADLSSRGKLERFLYKTLRNELDSALIQYGIIDAYHRFQKASQTYKFVEKRELKPRAKVTEAENDLIEGFIVLFCEHLIPSDLKKYIRYFENNRVVKENIPEMVLASGSVAPDLLKVQRNFEHTKFFQLLKALLPVDYALLIQPEKIGRSKTRYALTNFHVRIDWLIDFAAEALAKQLRYVSKALYEKGEKYAESIVEKLFEYYSFHHTASGRRTAAIVAYQLLEQAPGITSVYVNSSESRTLTRISEEGVIKHCLVKLPKAHLAELKKGERFGIKNFKKNYLLDNNVAVFRVMYQHNEHSTPPADGKLREIQTDMNWLKVVHQAIIPLPSAKDAKPIPYNIIYDQQDPFS